MEFSEYAIKDFSKFPFKGLCGKCGNYNEVLNRDCLCANCVWFGVKLLSHHVPETILNFVKPRF